MSDASKSPEDYLDDSTMDEVLENADSLLDNVEEMLDSIDSQLVDSENDSEFVPEELIVVEGKEKRPVRKSSTSSPLKKKAKATEFEVKNDSTSVSPKVKKNLKRAESTNDTKVQNMFTDEFDLLADETEEQSGIIRESSGETDEVEKPEDTHHKDLKNSSKVTDEHVEQHDVGHEDSSVIDISREEKDTRATNASQGLESDVDEEFDLEEHYMYETVTGGSDKVRERGAAAVPMVNEVEEDSDPFDLMEE